MSSYPIHHTFAPLATDEQIKTALALQVQPQKWQTGSEIETLRSTLEQYGERNASLFATGRDALLALLRALELRPEEEVIIQGYTCSVLPNAIIAAGGRPVYVDCDPETLTLDIGEVRQRISARSRAIICQHTFGMLANTKDLRAICNVHDLALIEDCAHIIPENMHGEIGKRADALLFSFGRDKALSGVTGGAVLTQHEFLNKKLQQQEEQAQVPTKWQVYNWISYPLRYQCAKKLWRVPLFAKAYLRFLQKVGWLPAVVTSEEKHGHATMPLQKMPNACATLILQQWENRAAINQTRAACAAQYYKAARKADWKFPSGMMHCTAPQKFPLFRNDAAEVRSALKRKQIYLDDGWCAGPVNPAGVSLAHIGYKPGSCKQAEKIANDILSLPTHPTMTDEQVQTVIHALEEIDQTN